MAALIECVPNFSEGRRSDVVEQIVDVARRTGSVQLLDYSSDEDHNRTVVTMAGTVEGVENAAFEMIKIASQLIDLNQHEGEHPRLGATDVVPFIPLRNATMDDCVAIAKRLGQRVGDELGIPVYLYEKAATRPDRVNLADVRRGEYEALRDNIATNPDKVPDYGPRKIGPAGATVIGARPFLIAYNVYLKNASVEDAKKVAKAIRQSGGGLAYVKGMGIEVEGMPQVSMNLTDFTKTPIHRVQELIRAEAARYGATIHFAELIGMIPQQALIDTARWYLQLDRMDDSQVLENRLNDTTMSGSNS